MCNRVDNFKLSIDEVSRELQAVIAEDRYFFAQQINAFSRPAIPIVLDYQGRKITHGTWGLYKEIPKEKPAYGINLTAEKSHTFYKKVEHNRCLIPVTGFYDWMHVAIPGGKTPVKVMHRMNWKNADHFYIAAYFDVWDNNEIGFGLVTTVANELMSVVHNSKLRMPVCLDAKAADRFLNDGEISEFEFPNFDPDLIAVNLEPEKMPNNNVTLF